MGFWNGRGTGLIDQYPVEGEQPFERPLQHPHSSHAEKDEDEEADTLENGEFGGVRQQHLPSSLKSESPYTPCPASESGKPLCRQGPNPFRSLHS